ncbi:sigma-54-dependent Fis family transcriptional regulator [Pelosinus sp. sgz500959]|uniref:sigma-54-dependent Fis family transcriptional regulator n=1 Tax=Pelosinus sp. sgz500959 TaxID=3242472 RepID=UPI00366DA743
MDMNALGKSFSHNMGLAWNSFIHSGKILSGIVSPLVAESWIKCANRDMNPTEGRGHIELGCNELKELVDKNEIIIRIANPFMKNLYKSFSNTGFIVVLADIQGYILESFGDKERLKSAEYLNFVFGANWSETRVGTNAIGFTLATGKPAQVSGCEHFSQPHHCWTCSAAPIFDKRGEIVAVLDVSGPVQDKNSHTLGMVIAAAEAISMQLKMQQKHSEIMLMKRHLESVFNTMSEGVLFIDKLGIIREVNAITQRLLNKNSQDIIGHSIDTVFKEVSPSIRTMLDNPQLYSDIKLLVPTQNGISHCMASGEFVSDEYGGVNGGVVILRPIQQVKESVTSCGGHQANFKFSDIIGKSPVMRETVRSAMLAAGSSSNVLLQGESGTGKELFAQAIHNQSARNNGPFIAVNCGAIPRELIGSELFGYVEGAFTGAKRGGRPGKFELAAGGTLFLDEIGDMPLEQQVTLLRVLQEKKINRIGSDKVIATDVRIICATNKNLLKEVKQGTFRQDLYYRLNVISLTSPPLRERGEDIILLITSFLQSLSKNRDWEFYLEPEVVLCLKKYSWPGNVRELHNVAERIIHLVEGNTVSLTHLPAELYHFHTNYEEVPIRRESFKEQRKQQNEKTEREELITLLRECNGNISHIAKRMGVARTTVYRKMQLYAIQY